MDLERRGGWSKRGGWLKRIWEQKRKWSSTTTLPSATGTAGTERPGGRTRRTLKPRAVSARDTTRPPGTAYRPSDGRRITAFMPALRLLRPSSVPLRRACSTTTALRAEIAALKAQVTSLGASPVAAPHQREQEPSLFAGAAGSSYTTDLKFYYPHADGALCPASPKPCHRCC